MRSLRYLLLMISFFSVLAWVQTGCDKKHPKTNVQFEGHQKGCLTFYDELFCKATKALAAGDKPLYTIVDGRPVLADENSTGEKYVKVKFVEISDGL